MYSRPLKAEIKGRTLDAENLIESFASLLPKRGSDCSKPSGSAHAEPFIALTPPDVLPAIWANDIIGAAVVEQLVPSHWDNP
jgi:hypothetical protein